jgi:hypothetical protein
MTVREAGGPSAAAVPPRPDRGRGPRPALHARLLASEPALFACFLALGLVLVFHRVLWSGFHQTAGDYVDHLLGNFTCEHEFRWLIGRPDHAALWDPPVFFPARGTLVYAETLLGAAPYYSLWRLLGFAPDTAYQLWMMTLSALNFAAAFLLFRGGFGCRRLPAAAGAFLCAFGNELAAQVNNPQLQTIFYTYLAVYFLCRLFRDARPHPWSAAGFVASLTAQLYSCFYLGWLSLFLLGLAGVWLLAARDRRRHLLEVLRANAVPLAAATACAAVALSPFLIRAVAVVRGLGWSSDPAVLLPEPRSWFYMGRRSLLYFWFSRSPVFASLAGEPEQRLGLGAVTAVCAGLGYWRSRGNPWMRLLAVLAVALVALTTELPGGFSLWHGVRLLVPGARTVRYASRAGVLLLLPAAAGLAAYIASRRQGLATLALVGLCCAEQAYSEYTFSKDMSRATTRSFAAAVPRGCRSVYLAVREGAGGAGSPAWVYQAEIMRAQLEGSVPFVNGGYTRFQPPGYGSLSQNVIRTGADVERLQRDLAAWKAAHGLGDGDVCWTEVASPRQVAPRSGGRISRAVAAPPRSAQAGASDRAAPARPGQAGGRAR